MALKRIIIAYCTEFSFDQSLYRNIGATMDLASSWLAIQCLPANLPNFTL